MSTKAAAAPPTEDPAEQELVREAARAGTRDHWRVGAAVAAWFRRFAKGRAEADFSEAVNAFNPDAEFSADYVRRCRNVFEAFPERVGGLSWSHHLRALEGSAGSREAARNWLEQAAAGSWSVRDLLARMDEARAAAEAEAFEVISGDTVVETEGRPGGGGADDGHDDAHDDDGDPPFDADGAAAPPAASRRLDEPAEVVRIAGPDLHNEPVTVPPPKDPGPPIVAPPADSAPPAEVARWLCAVIEPPSLVLHHQVLRKIDRFAALPAAEKSQILEAVERLLGTLGKVRDALRASA
jgi:hypothetical protein